MPRYFPRASVSLQVIVQAGAGVKQVNTDLIPDSVQIQRRSHKHAATCDFTVRSGALTFDPDLFVDGFIQVALADMPGMEGAPTGTDKIRFRGYIDELKRDDNDRGMTVTGKARDLSALLRAPAVLDPKAIPRYEDDLQTNLGRILSLELGKLKAIGGGSLSDAKTIKIRDTQALASAKVGDLVGGTHKKGPVAMPKAKCSPWDAIEHLVGMCGRMVTMDGQDLVVRMPAEVLGSENEFDSENPKVAFLFGAEDEAFPNAPAPIIPAASVSRTRKLRSQRRGVACSAWDTEKRTTVTVVWPPTDKLPATVLPKAATEAGAAQEQIKAAKATAKPASGHGSGTTKQPAGKFVPKDDRDVCYIRAGVHSEAQLLEIAKQIYSVRSRQELEGTIATSEWREELLRLQNGDRILLVVSPNIEWEMSEKASRAEQLDFLQEKLGVDRTAATALLQAAAGPRQHLFYVKGVGINWAKDQKPSITVDFINLLTVRLAA